jgi:integrase
MGKQWIQNWIQSQESPNTQKAYRIAKEKFAEFCKNKGKNGLENIVTEYRAARDDDDRRKLQQFIDAWDDVLQEYTIWLKQHYVPGTVKTYLASLQSFFKKNKIPIDIDIPKNSYVTYPKKDLKRKTIQLIITRSTVRNRAIWLMLAESGLRPDTVTNIRWWWIKEDFLAKRIPMRINVPQQFVKDKVGDRWSFIGEDGFRALKEYLEPRLPLQDDDYVFVREPPKPRKKRPRRYVPGSIMEHREDPERLPGIPFTSANLSATFGNTVRALNLDSGIFGKPGKVRLYCLKNWFRNHCEADYGYREFWMCRSSQVDSHYVSRNPEDHYERYDAAYPKLRIMEEPPTSVSAKKEIQQLKNQVEEMRKDNEIFNQVVEILRDPKKLSRFEKLITESTEDPEKGYCES